MNWDDQEYDDDYPEEMDEGFTFPCSHCGEEVYEDCEMCPACGEYVIRSTNPLVGKPDWYVWLAVLGIIAVVFTMLSAF